MFKREVTYYHHVAPPELFKKKGLRGYFVLVLNELVYFFQRRVEYHSMILLAQGQGLKKEEIQALKTRWKEEGSPRRAIFAALNGSEIYRDELIRIRSRQQIENKNTSLSSYAASHNMRGYYMGRRGGNLVSDFEKVGKSSGE